MPNVTDLLEDSAGRSPDPLVHRRSIRLLVGVVVFSALLGVAAFVVLDLLSYLDGGVVAMSAVSGPLFPVRCAECAAASNRTGFKRWLVVWAFGCGAGLVAALFAHRGRVEQSD